LPSSPLILETTLDGLTLHSRGKVRDIYAFPDDPSVLLIVATDRISAFDYVLGSGIPDKGKVLTQLSAFWFGETSDIVSNHMRSTRVADFPAAARAHADVLTGRSMLVRKTEPVPIECVARGYLSGSGWKEYQQTGAVCGVRLPAGMRESDRLPEPIFTPATKAATGHDINISEDEAGRIVGRETIEKLRNMTLRLYSRGAAHAEHRGIIVADTKFEFGRLLDGPGTVEIILIDEVLTPDSSRFWPMDAWQPGSTPPSFDKQPVRDYLDGLGWDKAPPPPALPDGVVAATSARYIEAYERITGRSFAEWPGVDGSAGAGG
jgi:phosphoribosylaminoimidazole-succinocarboxamide synthase